MHRSFFPMTDMLTSPPPLASAGRLIREEMQLLLPPTRETIDEYAAQHRRIPRRSGNGFDIYSHDEAPYLAFPMRTVRSHLYLTTAVVGPAQCGKTVIAE